MIFVFTICKIDFSFYPQIKYNPFRIFPGHWENRKKKDQRKCKDLRTDPSTSDEETQPGPSGVNPSMLEHEEFTQIDTGGVDLDEIIT